jgi:hypothetical protein
MNRDPLGEVFGLRVVSCVIQKLCKKYLSGRVQSVDFSD